MAEELAVRITLDSSQANSELKGFRGALSGLGDIVKTGFGVAGGILGAGLVTGIADIGKNAIMTGINFNAMQENAVTAFTTMLGSGEKAQALLKDLQNFSASTPFEFPEIAAASKSLLAFGVNAEDMTETLRRVGDISSGIGAPIGEIAELYGKAKVQGRLFGEDINQLTGRGIPIIQELAKQFGVNESEVKKLVEAGKVGFPNLEQAFKDLTSEGGQFSGMMDAQSKTFDGMMSTLKDNLAQVAGQLAGPLFEVAKTGLQNLLGFLSDPSVQAGIQEFATNLAAGVQQLGAIIQGAMPFVTGLVSQIQGLFSGGGTGGLTQWLMGLGGALNNAATTIMEALGPALVAVQPLLDQLGAVLGPLIASALQAIGNELVSHTIPQMAAWIALMLKGVPDLVAFAQAVGGKLNEAIATGKGLWDGLVKGFQDGIKFVGDVQTKLAELAGAINSVVGPALQSFNVTFLQPVMETFNKLVEGVKGVVDWLNELARILGVDVGRGFMDVLHLAGVPGFARGTSFAPGGLALVGERGPELVNLPRGSQVFTNSDTQRMMGGVTNVYVTYSPIVSLMDRAEAQTKLAPFIREALAAM